MASVLVPVILYSGDGQHWAVGFFFLVLLELSHAAFLHIGDLQAVVPLQTALLGPALDKVIVRTVLVLERAVVIVKIRLFAAEAPSYLPQGQPASSVLAVAATLFFPSSGDAGGPAGRGTKALRLPDA